MEPVTMARAGSTQSPAKERIARLFQFFRAFNEQEHPAPRHIAEQPWSLEFADLPRCSSVIYARARTARRASAVSDDAEESRPFEDDLVLSVSRPRVTDAPAPPPNVTAWVHPRWEDPFFLADELAVESAEVRAVGGNGALIPLYADAARVREYNTWCKLRNSWADREQPIRRALRLFEEFYALYALLEREGERHELILGDGILSWRAEGGDVEHPIVLQRLQLEFDPDVPEFKLRESAHPPEVYSSLFSSIGKTDGRALARIRDRFNDAPCHPLGGSETTDFLSFTAVQLSPHGRVVSSRPADPPDEPVIFRRPIVFQRTRTLGFGTALEAILEDIDQKDEVDFSSALARIVGVEPPLPAIEKETEEIDLVERILLSKPANIEQLRIAERLEKYGSVLVQGPPGTGKTHTIANLIGHLLSQGKTVLVTADTTKALRVVRDHVEEKLRGLCVSVLDNDLESRKQLEEAVNVIADQISKSDVEALALEEEAKTRARAERLEALRRAETELHDARADEYRTIEIDGLQITPADAARIVARDRAADGWIPAPLAQNDRSSLDPAEVAALYRTNATTTAEDERELELGELPSAEAIPSPDEVEVRVSTAGKGKSARPSLELWSTQMSIEHLPALEAIAERIARAERAARVDRPWEIAILFAGFKGASHREPWDRLLGLVESTDALAAGSRERLVRHAPYVEVLGEEKRLLAINEEIQEHLARGGKLGTIDLLLHRRWKDYLEQATVGGKRPESPQHFEALAHLLRLRDARRELAMRWDRLVEAAGGPSSTSLGAEIEVGTKQLVQKLVSRLDWHAEHQKPLLDALGELGFAWSALLESEPLAEGPHRELERIISAIRTRLALEIEAMIEKLRADRATVELERSAVLIHEQSGVPIAAALARALEAHDAAEYARAHRRTIELRRVRTEVERRAALLEKVSASAPAWAAAIRCREGIHARGEPPGDFEAAWRWRRISDELDRRASKSLSALQAKRERAANDLCFATSDLIEVRAWLAQRRRMTLAQQQSLTGWLDTQRAIGKGTGKKVPELKMEARRLMSGCQTAVPVWIMPMSRAVESFDPRHARFDVVIIDEASQCNLFALVALYLAKQVVVVGDHEQVSPSAVGESVEASTHLIAQHLRDIPNAHLYDGRLSVYDLARQSFGGMLALREHFRSVPSIIEFSNQLSYHGRIQPLRDGSQLELSPTTIAFKVEGGVAIDKVNRAEAETVAALLLSALDREEYARSTFGVISLVGEEQAYEVEGLLRRCLPPREFERRRIVCGNAAHFQGDERDVMFLTLVDVGREGAILPLRDQQSFKQRFNVAASRAKNQMWVVHSLDPNTDLKSEDLRRRLILHAESSDAALQDLTKRSRRHASELERLVFERLVGAGFEAHPDARVGNCRIDIVVQGEGKNRVAMICDGDRSMTKEALTEDIARQAVLERLGWSFVRVRATEFYRDPDGVMDAVLSALEAHGIRAKNIVAPTPPVARSDLTERVIAGARELLRTRFGGVLNGAEEPTGGDKAFRRFHKRRKRTGARP
jgi:very-short-patch-repair endonuclease